MNIRKEEILKKLKEINKEKYSILKLGLFGSFSKNINTGTFKDEVFSKVGGEPLHETYVNNNKYNEVWTSNTGNGLMYMVMSFWQENKISMSIEYCYSFQLARPFVHF